MTSTIGGGSIGGGGGGGAVDSVNGKTGVVVLDAADVGALALTGGTMSGAIDMGAQAVSNASTFNGVPLTAGGSAGDFLAADGSYTTPPRTLTFEASDAGNRAPGAALRSGGDRFHNKTGGIGIGVAMPFDGTITAFAFNRRVPNIGLVEFTVIDTAGNVKTTTPENIGAASYGATTTSIAVLAGEAVYVGWDSGSSGSTQDLAVTFTVEVA